jgi:hypothetical protein
MPNYQLIETLNDGLPFGLQAAESAVDAASTLYITGFFGADFVEC